MCPALQNSLLYTNLNHYFSREKAALFYKITGWLQLKCDGTRWRKRGEVKEKLANGVGSLHTSSEHGVSSITTADTHTSAAIVD
jgi:hypothetical protein